MPLRSTKNNTKKVKERKTDSTGIVLPSFGATARLFFSGFMMLPVSIALIRTLLLAEHELGSRSILGMSGTSGMFLIGFLLFALIYIAFRIPSMPYVFGHELTHVIFGLARGAGVSKFKVHEEKGSVKVTEGGILVLLSPYFFPIYAVLLLLVFGSVSLITPVQDGIVDKIFAGTVGIAWSFHFCFTINGMLQPQSDLEVYGFFFSFSFILMMNLFALCLVFVALSSFSMGEIFGLWKEMMSSTLLWFWNAFCNFMWPG